MKKRLRGLLALALALCMGLGMTTGIASAATMAPSTIKTGDLLQSGTGISSQDSGIIITYQNPDGTGNQDSAYQGTDANGATIYPSLQIASTIPEPGYVNDRWKAVSYSLDTSNGTALLTFERIPITYRIHYYANGGEGSYGPVDFKVTDEEPLGYGSQIFKKTGYHFTVWGTESSGGTTYSGASYMEDIVDDYKDDQPTEGTGADTGKFIVDIDLYAQYAVNEYRVTFDPNFETTQATTVQWFFYDQSAGLLKNEFKRDGYKFTGWNTKEDGSGTAYSDGQTVKNLTTEHAENIILYAQWEKGNAGGDGTGNDDKKKLDSSPDAGDNAPLGLLAMLMIASLAGIAAYKRREA